MGQGRILNRAPRKLGAVQCALLGLISLGWIIRDLGVADEPSHLWWTLAGLPYRVGSGGVFGSSPVDLVLLALCLFTAIAALRSSAAAGALVSVAAVTIVLRLPSLWNLSADWMQGIPGDLKTRANVSAWAQVAFGVLLLITVAAGRRPADRAAGQYDAPDGSTADLPPTRPARGPAVVAALFLGAAGCITGAWQIYWAQHYGWDTYRPLLTGEHTLVTLLSAPASWSDWAFTALAVTAAAAAAARASFARPLGMTAAALALAQGVSSGSVYAKLTYLEHYGDLPTVVQLGVLTGFFAALAGLVALLVLARRGVPAGSTPVDGWTMPPSTRPVAPPYGAFGQYPDDRPGDGHGGQHPGYGAGQGGGFGAGQGGGFGPPPPASPPPPPSTPPSPPAGW